VLASATATSGSAAASFWVTIFGGAGRISGDQRDWSITTRASSAVSFTSDGC
jgi:hypothetical protein